jgi:hypothetical protein
MPVMVHPGQALTNINAKQSAAGTVPNDEYLKHKAAAP